MSTMTEVDCKPHVTFNLASTCFEGGRHQQSLMAGGEPFSSPTALVKQHGFDVRPGTAAAYAQQRGGCGGGHPYYCQSADFDSASDEDETSLFGSLPFTPGGFKTPGVRGLLDLSNASSGTPGACSLSSSAFETSPTAHVEVTATAHVTPGVQRLVKAVQRGLRACQEPEAAEQGLGGTYFFMNEAGRKVAIMKPCDEEPLAPNNPKGFVGRNLGDLGLKPTVRVGEAAMREVAAYLLDHDHWAKVPHTSLVRVAHSVFHVAPLRTASSSRSMGAASSGGLDSMQSVTFAGEGPAAGPAGVPCKLGSLQEFVSHECDTSECGPSRFAARDVHRIGVLDVRLLNTDRHAGNMLVRKPPPRSPSFVGIGGGPVGGGGLARLDDQRMDLVPIDHGFCLPEALEPPYFEWLYWPQAMIPFKEDELEYIAQLDARRDIQLLRDNLPNLPEGCLRTLEVTTCMLQKGAAAGLSLFEIGSALSRPLVGLEEEPSELERACAAARAAFDARREAGDEADSEDADEPEEEDLESDEDDDDGAAAEDVGEEGDYVVVCGTKMLQQLLVPHPEAEPEQLLFSFEEERGASSSCSPPAAGGPPRARRVAPRSMSLGSAGGSPRSSQGGRMSLDTAPSEASAVTAATLESPFAAMAAQGCLLTGGGGPGKAVVGAKSLCPGGAGGGFSSAHHAAARRARRRTHSHAASKPRKASKYPPPVRTTPPSEAVSALFDGLDDEDDWTEFMALLADQIDDALRSGAWRASASAGVQPGMSCPKF